MKFTTNWLKEYVDFDLEPGELADRLTMAGLEVDSVDELFADLVDVRVAAIDAVRPHPNADRLVLCDISVGSEKKQIVCGAPNARAGMLTPVALPGAVLPGGLKIKKGKIRGEVSEGMLCSARDLGISDDHQGIMELDESLQSGDLLVEALGLADVLIDVDLTPNRADCASVIGIGREVAAFVGTMVRPPVLSSELPVLTGKGLPFAVQVEAPDDCPRYAARLLRNVKVAPSPWWLQKQLLAVGLRPINNVVDITNFVMMETGQPLHAFDFNKINGGKIVVRKALSHEKIITLDGQERQLDPEILMICDRDKPVAVAGVMGGANSEVEVGSSEILVESACFDPVSVRRTARKLNLGTDASFRFERGVDPQAAPAALERVVRLMVEICEAEPVADGFDICVSLKEPPLLKLRVKRTSDLLGVTFSAAELSNFLTAIEFKVTEIDSDTLEVTAPTFRVDIEREIDLVEEIARLKGYNDIPTTLPVVPMRFSEQDSKRLLRLRLAEIITSIGFNQAINYSFVAEKHFDLLGLAEDDHRRQTVRLLNPLAEDQNVMRTTLLPGLLENVRRNVNHQVADVHLFEIGKVFHPVAEEPLPDEKFRLAVVLSGRSRAGVPVIHFGQKPADILDIKGVAETIFRELRLADVEFVPVAGAEPFADTLMECRIDQFFLGWCGKFSRPVLKNFAIRQDVFFLDIDFEMLSQVKPASKKFISLPKFPAVRWDIAVLVADSVGGGDMLKVIMNSGEPLLEQAEIVDVYQGDPIEEGKKSVAISISYRSSKGTLDDDTVSVVHQKMIDLLLSRFDGQLREV